MGEPSKNRVLEEIKERINEFTMRIKERMRELGEEDVMDFREDQIIKDLITKICTLYREGVGECEHYDNIKEPICELFISDPEILARLELSEERICPIRSKPTKT